MRFRIKIIKKEKIITFCLNYILKFKAKKN